MNDIGRPSGKPGTPAEDVSRRRFLTGAGAAGIAAGLPVLVGPSTAEASVCDEYCVNVRDHGANGDGQADDFDAFANALAAIQGAGGGVLRVPGGTYRVDSALSYTGSRLHVDLAPDAVIDFSNAVTTNGPCWTIQGTQGSSINLTSNASPGDTTLAVASTTGIGEGDWLKVDSQAFFAGMDDNSNDQKVGELVQVASAGSGLVTLRTPLAGGPYVTGDSASVAKLSDGSAISITGGTLIGGGGSNPQACFRIQRTFGLTISNVDLQHFANVCIDVRDSSGAHLEGGFMIGGESNESTFYGIALSHSAQDCTVSGYTFHQFRHAISTGGSNGPAAVPGIPRRNTIANCHAFGTTSIAFYAHSGGEHLTVIGCTAHGCDGIGVGVKCPSAKVLGCTFTRCKGGVTFENETLAPSAYTAEDNTVVDCSVSGIQFVSSDTDGIDPLAGSIIRYVKIAGNTLWNAGSSSIAAHSVADYRLRAVSITNNIVGGQGAGPNAVSLRKADHCSVSGNSLFVPVGSMSALRVTDCHDCRLDGNTVVSASATSTVGIRLIGSSRCLLVGNIGRGLATGASADADCTNDSFCGNDFRDCTSGYNLSGSGSGHLQTNNTPGTTPPNLASGATLTLSGHGPNGVYKITGTGEINTVAASGRGGQAITLIFTSAATLKDGTGNLRLKEDFTGSVDDVVRLVCDGTSWFEESRSVN